jgi:hypothetical protein
MRPSTNFWLLCVFLAMISAPRIYPQALQINGAVVPPSRIIAYLFIGHSNMAGRGAIVDTLANPQVWHFFIDDGFQLYPNHTWIVAKDPLYMDYKLTGSNVARPFLNRLASTYPGYNFGILQNAGAGAKVIDYQTNKYDEMITAAQLVAPYVTFGGIVCMLGVTDAEYDPSNFLAGLRGIIERFRSDLKNDTLPLIMGQFEYTGHPDSTTHPYWRAVKKLVDSVPQYIPHSYLVPVDSLEYIDNWHFTANGNDMWAARAYDIAMGGNLVPAQLPVQILSPDSDIAIRVGDTLTILWRADYYVVSAVRFRISLNQGMTWTYISSESMLPPRGQTGVCKWQVPAVIGEDSIAANKAMLQIIDYDKVYFQTSKATLTLESANVSVSPSRGFSTHRQPSPVQKSMEVGTSAGLTLIAHGITFGLNGRVMRSPDSHKSHRALGHN